MNARNLTGSVALLVLLGLFAVSLYMQFEQRQLLASLANRPAPLRRADLNAEVNNVSDSLAEDIRDVNDRLDESQRKLESRLDAVDTRLQDAMKGIGSLTTALPPDPSLQSWMDTEGKPTEEFSEAVKKVVAGRTGRLRIVAPLGQDERIYIGDKLKAFRGLGPGKWSIDVPLEAGTVVRTVEPTPQEFTIGTPQLNVELEFFRDTVLELSRG